MYDFSFLQLLDSWIDALLGYSFDGDGVLDYHKSYYGYSFHVRLLSVYCMFSAICMYLLEFELPRLCASAFK